MALTIAELYVHIISPDKAVAGDKAVKKLTTVALHAGLICLATSFLPGEVRIWRLVLAKLWRWTDPDLSNAPSLAQRWAASFLAMLFVYTLRCLGVWAVATNPKLKLLRYAIPTAQWAVFFVNAFVQSFQGPLLDALIVINEHLVWHGLKILWISPELESEPEPEPESEPEQALSAEQRAELQNPRTRDDLVWAQVVAGRGFSPAEVEQHRRSKQAKEEAAAGEKVEEARPISTGEICAVLGMVIVISVLAIVALEVPFLSFYRIALIFLGVLSHIFSHFSQLTHPGLVEQSRLVNAW